MIVRRAVIESPIEQGKDEKIAYLLTTTPWGSTPSNAAVTIFDSDGTDVSSTCLSGSATIAGNVITTPLVQSLTAGEQYRLEIKFTSGGNVFEPYCLIYGKD